MTQRPLAPLLLAALASLAACTTPVAEQQEAKRERSPCDYYPLAVGNRWVYDSPQPDGSVQKLAVTITGNAQGYFQDDKGGNLACTPSGVRDGKRYMLEAPLEKGHSWKAVTGIGTTEVVTIDDVGAPVTTPAGTFTETVTVTNRTRIDAQRSLEVEWVFARGVGIVRFQTRAVQAGQAIPQISAQLREFQPAPAAPGAPAAQATPKT